MKKILSFEEFINESEQHPDNNVLDKICKVFSDEIKKHVQSNNDKTLVKWDKSDGLSEFPDNSYIFTFNFDDLGYQESSVYFDIVPEKPLSQYKNNELLDEFVEKFEVYLSNKFDNEEFDLNDLSDKNIEYLKNILRKTCEYIKKNVKL